VVKSAVDGIRRGCNLVGFLDAFKAVLAVANRSFGALAASLTPCKDFA
jgi:hypothetical protein